MERDVVVVVAGRATHAGRQEAPRVKLEGAQAARAWQEGRPAQPVVEPAFGV